MAAMVVAGIVSQLNLNEPAIIKVRSLKSLGKGSFWRCGQSVWRFYTTKHFGRRNKNTYFR